MGAISTPFIPEKQVKTVLISHIEKEGSATLKNLGIATIMTQSSSLFAEPVAHHPDMQFLHLKENICVVNDKKQPFVSSIENIGFKILEAKNNYSQKYPHDIGLNCLIIGKTVVGNIAHIDITIKEELSNYNFVHVSQGYTKCSTCIVNEDSLITEDESIYRALKNDFDVLKIESGCVELDGYNYGFFGGCTGLIDKNVLAINGELKSHKSYKDIAGFLKYRNIDFIELKIGNLKDIGSILPLEEK